MALRRKNRDSASEARPWESSGRYTAKLDKLLRNRPLWHRYVGLASVIGGLVLFIACEASLWGIHKVGGHVWFIVGIALAVSSVWWFGAFDTPT